MQGDGVFQADLGADTRSVPLYEGIYVVLASIFVVALVITNMVGIKLFRSPFDPEFALTTGILTYPVTFLITDIVSEIYGKKRADFMVGIGFAMSLLMLAVVQLAIAVPGHPAWTSSGYYGTVEEYQTAFESTFAITGVLLFGSMAAYLCAQLVDNWLYHFWKRLTGGKHLWLRNNGSTMISQLVDTAIVNSILFYIGFGMELGLGVQIMVTIYLHKLLIAVLDTPFIYLGVYVVKRLLGARFHEEVAR